jgi:hypothetical protein
MKKPQDEMVYAAVLAGELEIDAEGRIWRLMKRGWDRWQNKTVTRPCRRVRAENDVGAYLMIRSMWNRERVCTGAHRLVFRHFKGPIPPGITVNHENGQKKDNRPENLTLATYSAQARHALHVLRVGRVDQNGERNAMAKLREGSVREIRRRRIAGESLRTIAEDFRVSDRTVSKIARRERWGSIS